VEGAVALRAGCIAGEGPPVNALLCIAAPEVYDRAMATVGEIMTSDVLGLDPATSIVDAARRMQERRVGAVVVTEGDRLVGIVTERDVLRAVATGSVDGTLADAMTHAPDTVEPNESAGHAAALMIHGGFRHLPVVDGGNVVGMLSIRDLVRVTVDDEAPRGA
jgi:CBS domain-containing protein